MILMVPYIVRTLGLENYGIFGLMSAFVAPMGLIGLGISPAIIRGVASHRDANGKSPETARKYVRTGTTVSLAIGLIGGVAISSSGPWLFASFFPKANISQTALQQCFLFVGVQWLGNQLCGTWSAVAIGLQEYRYTAVGQIAQNILSTGFGVFALWMGFGLVGYVFATALASVLLVAYWMGSTAKLLGKNALFPGFDSEIAKSSMRFGAWFSLAQIGKMLSTDAQRYIAGLVLGPAAVGVFNIANRVMTTAYSINGKILEVLFPHFSSQADLSPRIRFNNLVMAAGVCSLLSAATLGSLSIVAYPVLSLWIGVQVAAQGHSLLQLLCLGGLFIALSGPVYFFLLAEGKSRVTAGISLLAGALMTVASLFLTPTAGLLGIGCAFAMAGSLTLLLYIIALTRLSRQYSHPVLKAFLIYSFAPMMIAGLIFLSSPFIAMIKSWVSLIAVYSALFFVTLLAGGLLLQIGDRVGSIGLNPLKRLLEFLRTFVLPLFFRIGKLF